jgi:hypothetical protein
VSETSQRGAWTRRSTLSGHSRLLPTLLTLAWLLVVLVGLTTLYLLVVTFVA